jgi:hypothetical protein
MLKVTYYDTFVELKAKKPESHNINTSTYTMVLGPSTLHFPKHFHFSNIFRLCTFQNMVFLIDSVKENNGTTC